MKPHYLRARVTAWIALPVVALCLALGAPARAGSDDFEFGRRLAEKRYFKLAKKVFDGMLADPTGTPTSKDLARYGLATLGYEEAQGAAGKPDVPFADVVAMANAAGNLIAEFAQKNPKHERAGEARILVGTVQIWVVTWAKNLLENPERMTARKTTAGDVLAAARTAVDKAEKQFEGLRNEPGLLGSIATYHWTMCQYWRALVFEPCSPQQVAALTKAAKDLEQYSTDHDGELLGIFASDIMGLTFAEQAKCATNDEEKLKLTNKALQSFETCIVTEYSDNETLTVIANGYLHFAQTCLAAKRIGTTNFLRNGVEMLSKMLETVPNLEKHPNGINALLVYGDLQLELGNTDAALNIYADATKRAAALGDQGLVEASNKRQKEMFQGKGSGSINTVTDVSVLTNVANSLFAEGKHADAINAFRAVIGAASHSPAGFVEHAWPAWERIAQSYEALSDPLAASMALEAVFEAWQDGRIPFKKGDESDRNMNRAGSDRRRQASLLSDFAGKTGSAVFRELYKRVDESFVPSFPDHPSTKASEINNAINRFREAREARRTNDSSWRTKMDQARADFDRIATNPKSDKRDFALQTVVSIDLYLVGGAPDAKKAAQRGLDTAAAALAYWETPEAKKVLVDYPQLAAQRQEAIGEVRYYRGELLKAKQDWDAVLTDMEILRKDPAGAKHAGDALALSIEAAIEKGDMALADTLMAEMLEKFPKQSAVDALVRKLAKKYDDEYRDLTQRWNKSSEELNGTREDRSKSVRTRLDAAKTESNNKQNSNVELNQQLAVFERDLAQWKRDPKLLGPGWRQSMADEIENVKIPDLKTRIAEAAKAIPELDKKVKELEAHALKLEVEMGKIVEDQYRPLREAVQRYQKGFDSTEGKNAKDAFDIGSRWYFAARNKKGQEEDWTNARRMLETYLALDAVKSLPESDPTKRMAIVRMGRVYSYFANKEQDPAKRAEIVGKAVVMLESTLAQRPENNELVVGLLEGRYGAYTWEDESARDRPVYRFIIPRTENAAALKDVIQKLGTPESRIAVPVVSADGGKQALYKKGVNDWKAWLTKTPGAVEMVWRETRGGGLDAATYGQFATTDADFRLALAAAYAESGTDADFAKGEAVLGTLLKGNLAPEDFSDKWWDANTITLRLWIGATERWAAQGGAVAAKASEYRKRSRQLILGRTAFAAVPPEERPEWKSLIERLNKGLRSENAPPLDVNLDRPVATETPEEKPETPPAPAPETPPAPAGPDAGAPGAPPGGGAPGGTPPAEPPAPEPPPAPAPPPEPAPGAPGGAK